MDVDLNLQNQRPTRDASGNAIWRPSGANAKISPGLPIRFRHVALFLLGSGFIGCFIGLLIGLPVYGLIHSKFVAGSVAASLLYATFIVGYHWTGEMRGWPGLHALFSPVGRKPLLLSALTAIATIAFIYMVRWILLWAGIKFADDPAQIELDSWKQLPLALLLLVLMAPLTEELIFRGILLDCLKQKMNVWMAAALLSVIFSLFHFNPFSLGAVGWLAFSARFLQGVTASAFAIKYRSLRPAFVLHATWNAIGCMASLLNT
jgi:membrane protease YdiL (CAAX protease family)